MVIKFAMEDGEPRLGYFYALYTERENEFFHFETYLPRLIQSVEPGDEDGDDLLNLTPMHCHYVYWHPCGHHLGPETKFRPELEYTGVKEVGNMSWYYEGHGMVCKKDLAIRLLTSELLGINVQRAEFQSPGWNPEPKDWYFIQGGGPNAWKQPIMTPETYKCWNCNKEPVCSVCGWNPPLCPHCEADYSVGLQHWDGKDESLLVCDFEEPMIDLKAWDGSDYFGSTITHRMLQFLLSCHAHPFRALPIPVDVKNATADQLEQLELARTPI